jgi:endonuclease/exonuclease/phosphatase (EEP) superfamily protein YafD
VTDKTRPGATAGAPKAESSPKPKRRRRGVVGCVAGIALGLAGLVGARLAQLWIAFDVFTQFSPQFMFVVVAFAIGLFSPRAKILASSIVLIVLLVAQGMWPYYASSRVSELSKVATGERELKVASFNAWLGNKDVEAVRAEVARIDADVIALLELGAGHHVIYDQLKAQYPFNAQCANTKRCTFGILSKYPLSNVTDQMVAPGPAYMRASLGPEFGGLAIFAVHTNRFPESRAQLNQVKALVAELETVTGPHIVMGDFNATPYSRVTETLSSQANLTRFTNLPTWPARFGLPQIAIDHIFASPGIRQLESQSIGNSAGSDHFPIFLKVAVPVQQ